MILSYLSINSLGDIDAFFEAKDIATLEKIEDSSLESEILIQAKNELLASLIKPNENLSKGQINAYTHINGALKYHNETKDLYMFGLVAKKKVLSEGVYKETNISISSG